MLILFVLLVLLLIARVCCYRWSFWRTSQNQENNNASAANHTASQRVSVTVPEVEQVNQHHVSGIVNAGFVEPACDLPPSYEEAIKMPKPISDDDITATTRL